jgi:hypothetical protein
MHDRELHALFPTRLTRGALLRADGAAIGLVSGGAPAWDLLSLADRAQAGSQYHRLLLALDYPIDVLVVDQPPDLEGEIAELRARRDRLVHPLLADALDEVVEYVSELSRSTTSRAKQVIWVVGGGVGTPQPSAVSPDLVRLLRIKPHAPPGQARPEDIGLARAVERARRLADALRALGGTPSPRLMEAEEIARLLYALADPVRASHYPLEGALLDRVRRVVVVSQENG